MRLLLAISLFLGIEGFAAVDRQLIQSHFEPGDSIEYIGISEDQAPIVRVDFERLRVTQKYIGKKVVETVMLPALLKKDAQTIQKISDSDPVEGIIFKDLDGQYSVFYLDGHHRSYSYYLYNQQKKTNLKMAVKLTADYTGDFGEKFLNINDLAEDLILKRHATYTPGFKTPYQKTAYLLNTAHNQIHEVENCDLRGDIGTALFELNLKTQNFKNYLEFFIGETLQTGGCEVPELQNYASVNSEAHIEKIQKKIFASDDCLSLFMLSTHFVKVGHESDAAQNLIEVKGNFNKKFPELAKKCLL